MLFICRNGWSKQVEGLCGMIMVFELHGLVVWWSSDMVVEILGCCSDGVVDTSKWAMLSREYLAYCCIPEDVWP